jgi:hypothetical protein
MASDGARLLLAGMDARRCDGRLLWMHQERDVIGRVEELREAGPGRDPYLEATVRLDLHTEQGRRQYDRRAAGRPLSASASFYQEEPPDQIGGWVREWRLDHVSLVVPGKGADPGAVTEGWRL